MNFVVPAWKIPDERIKDFVAWNADAFRDHVCLIVTDRDLDFLPDGFCYSVFDCGEIFNLSKCANHGLKFFANGVICKTDIDCAFTPELVLAMENVTFGHALVPIYIMCDCPDGTGQPWSKAAGTVAMRWGDWLPIGGYNERMEGYGVDDGDLVARAKRAGMRIDRTKWLRHVAHGDQEQGSNPKRRPDFWNRDGVNPKNHTHNRRQWMQWTRKDFLKT